MQTQSDIRTRITNRIVDAVERGCPPWRRPWSLDRNIGAPANAVSGRCYTGVNPLLLQIAAERHGWTSRYWMTFRQAEALGGRVKKRPDHVAQGDWAAAVVFCKPVPKLKRQSAQEDGDDETFRVMKTYSVFNVDQIEGPALDRLRAGNGALDPAEIEQRFERAEQVIAATGAEVRHGGDQAFYHPAGDFIQMPPRDQFSVPEYYETLFHETAHWTEHPTRLNWDRSLAKNSYAVGELRAELAACFLAGETGVPILEMLDNHSSYIRYWLAAMKGDPKFIFRASALATKAADYVLGFSRTEQPEQEPELVA